MKINFNQKNRFFLLALGLAVLFVYANSLQNSFHYDDFHVIVKNPSIKDSGNLLKFFSDPKLGSGLVKETFSYRPLIMISFALNYSLGGLDVLGFRIVNILLHVFCTLLVFAVTLGLLQVAEGEKAGDNETTHRWMAFFAALIFAVHPVQTESVTYITGRSSSLLALFYLAAVWGFIQYRRSGKFRFLIGSSLAFACALLVKETAITLPLILFVFIIFFPLGQTRRQRFFSFLPYVLISGSFLFLRFYLFGSVQYRTAYARPLFDNILTQPQAWIHYLGSFILPLNLNVDYDFPVSHSIFGKDVIRSIVLLSALALILWRIARVQRLVGFFALWFAINLLPTNSLIPLEDVVADRWLYLPSVGLAVLGTLAGFWLYQQKIRFGQRSLKLVFFALCFLVVEFYGFSTMLRNFDWTSYWTIWEDAASKSPYKARTYIGLGLALNSAGRKEEAISAFNTALRLNQKAGEAHINLGYILFNEGKLDQAIEHFKQAIAMTPRLSPEGYNNLGTAYMAQGKTEEAIQNFQLALKVRPDFSLPYFNLANYYYEKQGDAEKAILFYEKAIQYNPEFIESYKALHQIYEQEGLKEKGQKAYENYLKYRDLGNRVFLGG